MVTYTIEPVSSFSDFLLAKLQEYEKRMGKRVSLDEFASQLGVSRPLVSYWLKGTKPSLENVKILAETFGAEIYDVLDLPRPNPYLQKITQLFERISPEHQRKLVEDAERYEEKNERSKKPSPKRKTS